MEWIKDYTDSATHPQMVAAGFWGRTVFRELCRISGRHNLAGRLVPEYLDPEFLAGVLGIPWDFDVDGQEDQGPVAICRRAVARCVEVGLLKRSVGNTRVFLIDGWDRRQPSCTPEAERKRNLRDRSPNVVPKMSTEVEVEVEVDSEKTQDSPALPVGTVGPSARTGKTSEAASRVFDHWKTTHRPGARVFDAKTRKAVEARLAEGFTEADLMRAIDGCKASPHHQGQNDHHKKYDSLELICRDGAKVQAMQGYLEITKPTIDIEKIRRGNQRAEDQGWEKVPFAEVKP